MSKNLVVKHNALINASYRLSLTEQRLILLSIVEARRTGVGITPMDRLIVSADVYMKAFNTTRQAAYLALKEACDNLFNREYGYTEIRERGVAVVRSRWVSEISYNENEATVGLIFAPSIVPYITNLEQQFTGYDIEQVAELNSKYAVRLYEIIIAWRTKGKTPIINIHELRKRLGVLDDEYKAMHNFKARVLDSAIQEINEKTDIKVSYKQHKNGRVITAFEFEFEIKEKKKTKSIKSKSKADNERDQNTIDMFNGLTDKQADMFSKILSKLTVDGIARLDTLANNLSEKEFATKLCDILKNPNNYDEKIVKRVFNNLNKHTDFNK